MENEIDTPTEQLAGYELFGPNIEQLRTAAEALGLDFNAVVAHGVDLMAKAKIKEFELEAEARAICGEDIDLANTLLGCTHVTHAIETARSSLGSMLKHDLFAPQVAELVTGCVVGLSESCNAFAGASMNKVCDLILGVGDESKVQRDAIFEKINEITAHKRDTFALVARINEDLMLRLQQAAEASVDSGDLKPTDVIHVPRPQLH